MSKRFLYEENPEPGAGTPNPDSNETVRAGNDNSPGSTAATEQPAGGGAPAATEKVTVTPAAETAKQPEAILNITNILNQPSAEELRPTVTPQAAETLTKEITAEASAQKTAEEKKIEAEQPKTPAMTPADFALNKMFANSIVEGADQLNSWGCATVSGEQKKEIFKAAQENKNELAQFMVLVMEKMGGKVPLWLYGIWLTGKTFAPPWIMVVKMKQQQKEIVRLKKQVEDNASVKNINSELLLQHIKKQQEDMELLKSQLAQKGVSNYAPNEQLKNMNEKLVVAESEYSKDEKTQLEKQLATNHVAFDPDAPFGKDGNGVAIAPYGINPKTGKPRRSNGGAKKKAA